MGVYGAAIIIVYSLRSGRMKIIWTQERRGRARETREERGSACPRGPLKSNFFPLSERAEISIG